VYAKFSVAKKAKHWQLRKPGKESGVGLTGGKKTAISATNVTKFASAISSAVFLAISALTDSTTNRTAIKEGTDDAPPRPMGESQPQ
jgi:hypothetical protein